MKILKWIGITLLTGFTLLVTGPFWTPHFERAFTTDEVRYRLTVTVDDNGRTVEGSTVLQVLWIRSVFPTIGSSARMTTALQGESAVVDLGAKGVLFTTMAQSGNYADPALIAPIALGVVPAGMVREKLPELRAAAKPGVTRELPIDLMPQMVTFGDINTPATAKPVNPNDLEKTFGPGVALKGMSITIVDNSTPLTKGIEKKLPWLSTFEEGGLDGTRYRDARVPNQNANMFGPASFSTRDLSSRL